MGTISNALNGYYQLSNLLSSSSGSSGSLTSSATSSPLQELEATLGISSGSGSSGSGSSYLLDLSPAAQALMNGSTSSGNGTSSTQFTLTSTQEAAIKNILEKYKDAPLTQATFQEIQNALQAAGLSPQALGAEDQIKSFNATNILMQALSGNYASVSDPSQTQSDEQTKESNYMQSIVSMWKSMDTGSSASGPSSASGVSSASGASL